MTRRATARVEGQQRLYIDYTIGKSDFELRKLGKEGKTGSQIKRNKKKERKRERKKERKKERRESRERVGGKNFAE